MTSALPDDVEAIMFNALLPLSLERQHRLVPDGFVVEYRARHDAATGHTYRRVYVRPSEVDPETFDFGTPGAYASITVRNGADFRLPDKEAVYLVHVFATNVACYAQSMGHVVAFTDPADGIRAAVFEIQDHIRREQRP